MAGPILRDHEKHAAGGATALAQLSAAAKFASSSNGPTTASTFGRASTSAATARTSSCVTASIDARISSTGSSRGIDQLGLAEPAHPGGRVLQPEHVRPAQLALAPVELGVGQPAGYHLGDFLLADGEHVVGLGGQAARVDAPHPGVGVAAS